MRKLSWISAVVTAVMLSGAAFAQSIDHFQLDWVNSGEQGKKFDTRDYPGSVFVIEFVQNDCFFCDQNVPFVKRLARSFSGDDSVKILDIGLAQQTWQLQAWTSRHNIQYPVLRGVRSVVGPIGVRGTPTTVIYDCNLNEVHRKIGAWDARSFNQVRSVVQRTKQSMTCDTEGPTGDIGEFSLPIINSNGVVGTFDSADHEDGIFVLEVIQNHCGACNQNAPNVDTLASRFADDDNVHVLDVGYSNQSVEDLQAWTSRHNPNHPVVLGNESLFDHVHIAVTPTTLVYDCQRNLRFRGTGRWRGQRLNQLSSLIAGIKAECQATED